MKKYPLLFLIVSCTFIAAAQKDSVSHSRLSLQQISFNFTELNVRSDKTSFQVTGFIRDDVFLYESRLLFSLEAGFRLRNKKGELYKRDPLLRLGVSLVTREEMNYELRNENRVYSGFVMHNDDSIHRDTVYRQNLDMNYGGYQVRINASLNFRKEVNERWTFFLGAGVYAGVSINTGTWVSYSERTTIESRYPSVYYPIEWVDYAETTNEYFINKPFYTLSPYAPLGFDFRFSKRNSFFKKLHLGAELRPGIGFVFIPELGLQIKPCRQWGVTLKYSL
jgi:hypothetical protein